MFYANILVSVDFSEPAPDRVRLAAALARRFDAVLTGAAAAEVPVPLFAHDIRDAARQYDPVQGHDPAGARAGAGDFLPLLAEARRTARSGGTDRPFAHLVAKARAADLVVVGRTGPTLLDPSPFGVAVAPVLMEAGRPVLIVPPDVAGAPGQRIVVAWKDTPEALRETILGALPFLRSSAQVFVVTTGQGAGSRGVEEVAAHLRLHGASVTTHLLTTSVSDSGEILRFARDQQADLIVMGAYGHARLREWAFGGVTREILQETALCCLMAH
ncbi:universal stress protein [Methylobacterium phyllosphaerae]